MLFMYVCELTIVEYILIMQSKVEYNLIVYCTEYNMVTTITFLFKNVKLI